MKIKTVKFNQKIIPAFSGLYTILEKLRKGELLEITDYYFGGGRYSGKSVSLHIFVFLLFLYKVDVSVFFFRNLKNTVRNSVGSYVFSYFQKYECLDSIKYNLTYHKIEALNSNFNFTAKGVNHHPNVVFKEMPQIHTRYCVIVEEKANEIKQQDRQAIIMAAGGAGLKQIIRFFLFNPTHSKQAIVNYCEEKLPFNEHLMSTRGGDLKVEKNALFYRTNGRVNPYMKEKD